MVRIFYFKTYHSDLFEVKELLESVPFDRGLGVAIHRNQLYAKPDRSLNEGYVPNFSITIPNEGLLKVKFYYPIDNALLLSFAFIALIVNGLILYLYPEQLVIAAAFLLIGLIVYALFYFSFITSVLKYLEVLWG